MSRGAVVLFLAAAALAGCGDKGKSGPVWVDELVSKQPVGSSGKEVQVHGFVRPGSIQSEVVDQTSVRTFVLERNGGALTVVVRGPVPDTFKDHAEVLAVGRLDGTGPAIRLEAREVQAGCLPPDIARQLEQQSGRPAQPAWCGG